MASVSVPGSCASAISRASGPSDPRLPLVAFARASAFGARSRRNSGSSVARNGDDQEGLARNARLHELEKEERRFVRRVEVLDDYDERRRLPRGFDEEAGDEIEELKPRLKRIFHLLGGPSRKADEGRNLGRQPIVGMRRGAGAPCQ